MAEPRQDTAAVVFDAPRDTGDASTGCAKTSAATPDRWAWCLEVATRYARKAPAEDRADVRQDILVALAEQERRDGVPLELGRARAIASNTLKDYWRKVYAPRPTIDLNAAADAWLDSETPLAEMVPDDAPIDLDAALDARATLRACPERILRLGQAIERGDQLNGRDRVALWQFRKTHKRP